MKNLLLPLLVLMAVKTVAQSSPMDVYELGVKGYDMASFDSITVIYSVDPTNPVAETAKYLMNSDLYVLSGTRQITSGNFSYHSSGGASEFRISEYDNDNFDTVRRYYFYRDAMGRDTLVRNQAYSNNVVGQTVDHSYYYNSQGQLDSAYLERYLPNVFLGNETYNYHYSAGRLDSIKYRYLPDSLIRRKYIYNYDGLNRLRYIDNYASSGGPEEYNRRDSLMYNASDKVNGIRQYGIIPINGTYYLYRETKFLNSQNIAISEQDRSTFSVYPNPVSNRLIIQGDEFLRAEVINLEGSNLGNLELNGESADVSHLRPGVYLLQIYTRQEELPQTVHIAKK